MERDCKVEELMGVYPVFRCLEEQQVNVDELDYLMKLTYSFFGDEDAQYQGMAYKLGFTDITDLTDIIDLINLYFSFRQATVIHKADCSENTTWLFLPAAKQQIQQAMARVGIGGEAYARFRFCENRLPEEIDAILDPKQESIFARNVLCAAYGRLSPGDQEKLCAAVYLARPEDAAEFQHLVENLELLDFIPGVHTPEEYGRYMIRDSGHFDYDPNLEPFYDFRKWALQRLDEEQGRFTEHGYISYQGARPLDELVRKAPAQQERGPSMGMGGQQM